ncbi:hypothetical protein [Desulfoferula mesophila]|uniref:Epoxyqueuosine reductase n=1 Tax=Desulfoferula mesophila TaxID=3058419 RepID=A0AAU9E8S9_9BACT|nr:hypothetical protein FAK_00630 [Desulfoferula mesophilus]
MTRYLLAAEELVAKAESYEGMRAGIADLGAVLDAPSYRCQPQGQAAWRDEHSEKSVAWLPKAASLLVLAMHHPRDQPRLDWFDRGNTAGNRRMQEVLESLAAWLLPAHRIHAQPLPYQPARGGIFLKDAAVLAGLGVMGQNNLFLHPQWGPRLRLRALLIQERLPAGERLRDFEPCRSCDQPCLSACSSGALKTGRYRRPPCAQRLERDRAHPIDSGQGGASGDPVLVTDWCRACELACPVGRY